MHCDYFGICGSCTLYNMSYQEQLNIKVQFQKERFLDLFGGEFEVIQSVSKGFRSRAEFKMYHDDEVLRYAMSTFDKKYICIEQCSVVNDQIGILMPKLLDQLNSNMLLKNRLFSVEFLTSDEEVLVTLIYHKKLCDDWMSQAKILQDTLGIKIIGRSRGQKIVLAEDFVIKKLQMCDQVFEIVQKEGGFTQPNSAVNAKMVEWVMANIDFGGDLCELYCGGGNFTIPLSTKFDKVLATEISKTSISCAKTSCSLSDIHNIEFVRMSSEDFASAFRKERDFFRLKEIDLHNYNFTTIFIDPPRAGVDEKTLELVSQFQNIIYISCNPETLKRDLEILTKTHTITKFAFFDQFVWTNHIESGVFLSRR